MFDVPDMLLDGQDALLLGEQQAAGAGAAAAADGEVMAVPDDMALLDMEMDNMMMMDMPGGCDVWVAGRG